MQLGNLGISILVLAGTAALVLGLGGYTFYQAKGYSYLVDDPSACVNCHVMQPQYDGWQHSNHREVAGCNGCHTPKGFASKWVTKAVNGWNHSVAFTTGDFHEPIVIRDWNLEIATDNCLRCHDTLVGQMGAGAHQAEDIQCTRCHADAGH